MDKMAIKRELKNIKRDLDYYMGEYNLSQKEAYSIIHANYYTRMMLTKNYVEIAEREKLYNSMKEYMSENQGEQQ